MDKILILPFTFSLFLVEFIGVTFVNKNHTGIKFTTQQIPSAYCAHHQSKALLHFFSLTMSDSTLVARINSLLFLLSIPLYGYIILFIHSPTELFLEFGYYK